MGRKTRKRWSDFWKRTSEREIADLPDDFEWEVGEDGGAAIDWFRKWSATDVVVPETFDGRPTTAIGRGASQKLHRLRSIELPASLRRLGSASAENCRLFAECSELTAINVAPGNAVFRSVDGVLYFADGKTLVRVPPGKRGAFVVSGGVERIVDGAFFGCSSLTAIKVASGNAAFRSVDGVLYSADGKTLIQVPGGKRGALVVPDGVERIVEGAFYGCKALTAISLPPGGQRIGFGAFEHCDSLSTVDFPNELREMGDGAFQYCSSLASATLTNGMLNIGRETFCGCSSLASVSRPSGLRSIGEMGFAGCEALSSISFPDGLRSIGDAAFCDCKALTSVALPDGLETLGRDAFAGCEALKEVALPKGLASIEYSAFNECRSLSSISLPEGVERIESGAFARCKALTEITLPASLKELERDAAWRTHSDGCWLEPPTVGAFAECWSLTEIKVAPGNAFFKSVDGVLFSADGKRLIRYPAGRKERCYAAPSNVETVEKGAFSGASLEKLVFSDGVQTLENEAVAGCVNLKKATFGRGLRTVEHGAFEHCRALETIVFPAELETLKYTTFSECGALSSIEIAPENPNFRTVEEFLLTADGKTLLLAFGAQEKRVVPRGVETIAKRAFENARATTEVEFPPELRTVEYAAFAELRNLRKVAFSEGPRTIGELAFWKCKALRTVVLPSSVEDIAQNAFHGCLFRLTFFAAEGSVGEKYARENKIRFRPSEQRRRAFFKRWLTPRCENGKTAR